MRDDTVPGRTTIDTWAIEPRRPLTVVAWDVWRDGWATVCFTLRDARGREYGFFFDGHLGRLCSGNGTHLDVDAAFVKKSSRLMQDVLGVLQSERERGTSAGSALSAHLDKALVYSGVSLP